MNSLLCLLCYVAVALAPSRYKPPGNLQNPLVAKNGRFPRFYFRRDTQHIRQEHITDLAIAPIANTQTTPVISKHTQTK